ncbi:MAG: HypC/HybG/HupF family hydrogenase formation chaperone [Sulfurimonas sp.]
MCLSIPSRVTKIDKERNVATVDTMGVSREASLDLMQDGSVEVGDYVLIHVGFVMNKIDNEDALLSLEAFDEIARRMEDDQ